MRTTKLIVFCLVIFSIQSTITGDENMAFHSFQDTRSFTEETSIITVLDYGATGDGITDDTAAIQAAMDACKPQGGTVLFPSGTYKIGSNITLDENVRFVKGAKLSVDNGITVTVTGYLGAGQYQIFDGSGSVDLSSSAATEVLPQWWGGSVISTFSDGDTTPSVAQGRVFKTANTGATTITMFDDGITGQVIKIIIGDSNTSFDFTGANLKGNGGADWSPVQGDSIVAVFDGADWYCHVDVSALQADLDDFPDELKNLVTAEIQQLENIGAATISTTQWGYVGGADQALTTSDSPTFDTVTAAIRHKGNGIYDVRAYGATGDGSTDDRAAINSAHTAATANGGVILFPSGSADSTYRISSDITFNSNVTLIFDPGAKLSIDNSVAVTVNGGIAPTLHQIFSGDGTVTGSPVVNEIYSHWFGAVAGDDSVDSAVAINKALVWGNKQTIVIPNGIVWIQTSIEFLSNRILRGMTKSQAEQVSGLKLKAESNVDMITIDGLSSSGGIRNLFLDGNYGNQSSPVIGMDFTPPTGHGWDNGFLEDIRIVNCDTAIRYTDANLHTLTRVAVSDCTTGLMLDTARLFQVDLNTFATTTLIEFTDCTTIWIRLWPEGYTTVAKYNGGNRGIYWQPMLRSGNQIERISRTKADGQAFSDVSFDFLAGENVYPYLIVSDGFEYWGNDAKPPGWDTQITGSLTLSKETTQVRSGSNALKMAHGADSRGGLKLDLNSEPFWQDYGRLYYSFYYQSDGASTNGMRVCIDTQMGGGTTGAKQTNYTLVNDTSNWYLAEGWMDTTPEAVSGGNFEFYIGTAGVADVFNLYIDDVRVWAALPLLKRQPIVSDEIDLSGAAVMQIIYPNLTGRAILQLAKVIYTEGSSADAGIALELGKESDRDYYGTYTTEVSKSQWYKADVTLSYNNIDSGDTLTLYSPGGKTGAGKVVFVFEISHLGNTSLW